MLESQSTSLGELSSLLGRMSQSARTGLWVAPLYYRALQRQQALLLHRFGWRPRCQISLSQPSLGDLRWWVSSSVRPFHQDRCILTGLGCTLQWHDNRGTLELEGGRTTHQLFGTQAAILALKAFLGVGMQSPPLSLGHHPPRHIPLEMDNTTAVAYVNRRGGGALSHHLCPSWPWNYGPSC